MNKENLLKQMNGKTITNGWDVICCMSAEHISSLLEEKYNKKEKEGVLYSIEDRQESSICTVELNFKVGPPRISFIEDDPTLCMLRLEIKSGEAVIDGKNTVTQTIPSGPEDKHKYYITAKIPLVVIQGSVKNGEDVVINFSQTKDVNIDWKCDDYVKQEVENALIIYFTTHFYENEWSLGRLIYTQNSELINLTPESFEFATSVEPNNPTSTGCLMLFITTRGGNKGNSKILFGVNGQIFKPYPDDFSAVLIISSKLLFKDILEPQFESIQSVNAKEGFTQLDTYKLEGSGCINCGRIDKDQKQDLEVPLTNLRVYGNINNQLEISWDEEWDSPVQYWHLSPVPGTNDAIQVLSTGEVHLKLSLSNSTYSFAVKEPSQEICISSNIKVNVEGEDISFFDGLNLSNVKKEVKNAVSKKLIHLFDFQLKGISIFAASNLLFPSYHIITYDEDGVHIPGDIIIWGISKSKIID